MSKIRALVLTGYGLNCDHETAHAFRLAGADAERIHINSLINGEASLNEFKIMAFVGGFSWGDDHGAGVVQAVRMKNKLGDRILRFIENGNLVLGICNGFQTIVNLGLLPGFDGNYADRCAAVTYNDCGRFRNDWLYHKIEKESPCVFTRGLSRMELPVRHGEGKFIAGNDILEKLSKGNQAVARYALPDGNPAEGLFPFNPNGSLQDIAGICDSTGRVFGLMPHPEAFIHQTNHPDWTRFKEKAKRKGEKIENSGFPSLGLEIFQNAVSFFS